MSKLVSEISELAAIHSPSDITEARRLSTYANRFVALLNFDFAMDVLPSRWRQSRTRFPAPSDASALTRSTCNGDAEDAGPQVGESKDGVRNVATGRSNDGEALPTCG